MRSWRSSRATAKTHSAAMASATVAGTM
jgi:hypothetical protein